MKDFQPAATLTKKYMHWCYPRAGKTLCNRTFGQYTKNIYQLPLCPECQIQKKWIEKQAEKCK